MKVENLRDDLRYMPDNDSVGVIEKDGTEYGIILENKKDTFNKPKSYEVMKATHYYDDGFKQMVKGPRTVGYINAPLMGKLFSGENEVNIKIGADLYESKVVKATW